MIKAIKEFINSKKRVMEITRENESLKEINRYLTKDAEDSRSEAHHNLELMNNEKRIAEEMKEKYSKLAQEYYETSIKLVQAVNSKN